MESVKYIESVNLYLPAINGSGTVIESALKYDAGIFDSGIITGILNLLTDSGSLPAGLQPVVKFARRIITSASFIL